MTDTSSHFVEHLFRREAGKLVSVLTKLFGPQNLELAEDVVQDTLIKAVESWRINGTPQNPTGWLFTAARNKALDVIRRERHHREFLTVLLKSEYSAGETIRQMVAEHEIEDEQLRMMFVCRHPSLPEESQVALILKTLCGFSVAEIAHAFLTNEENITKRLYRARQVLREEKIKFTIPDPDELRQRLDGVLTAIYLLFNEGYNSTHHESLIRDDLVEESLRLGKMIADHSVTRQNSSLAMLALFCFQAARLYGRVSDEGELLTLKEQDRRKWDRELIQQGIIYLREASSGNELSSYHFEAAIAYEHCTAASYDATDWATILTLYDRLYKYRPEPVIALNRLIVYGELNGAAAALLENEHLTDRRDIDGYYLYAATLGEWYARAGNSQEAKRYYERALELTKSGTEQTFLKKKISGLSR